MCRGDTCWRDLTAMCYHYQTQPVPNPFSWFLHHAPLRSVLRVYCSLFMVWGFGGLRV
jgi:hypothetical protein